MNEKLELNQSNRLRMKKSRHLIDFHIAGFAYCDRLDVIEELT